MSRLRMRPCLSPGRRIAARLFTNPSSTRLPELPLGIRSPSPLYPRLSPSVQLLPLFHAPREPRISLPLGPASGPALVTVRREHPSSPTPRPLLVYNLAVSPLPLPFPSSTRIPPLPSALPFPKRIPPAGAVANPGRKSYEGSARIQKLEPLTLPGARFIYSPYLPVRRSECVADHCQRRKVDIFLNKRHELSHLLTQKRKSEVANRFTRRKSARTHFLISAAVGKTGRKADIKKTRERKIEGEGEKKKARQSGRHRRRDSRR